VDIRTWLLGQHAKLTQTAHDLCSKKSQDYGNQADPFANFHTFGAYGILVRLYDKLARLKSFEEKGFHAVDNESTKDTVLDIINYAILYYCYRTLHNDNSSDTVQLRMELGLGATTHGSK
jgi:hypothetical protein